MARKKPKWRQVLNARYLRWSALRLAVRLWPGLGRRLAFFPRHIGLIEGADHVLADQVAQIPPDSLAPQMDFLAQCAAYDSRAPDVVLPKGAVTGRRTALFDEAWIDMANASILLPQRGRTVLVRGEVANWNAASARIRRARIAIPGRVFAPLVTRNYFHVILENGIRLLDLMEDGTLGDAPLTVVHPDLGQVTHDMLQGIAALYGQITVQTVPGGALIEPGQAVGHFPHDSYWEWPPVTRALADRLGAAFDAVYGPVPTQHGPDLYLSRQGAKLRNPTNAAALEDRLQGAGFEIFNASDANHPEQVARFRAADRVVAVHGAGLTNLIFCRPGTLVVEIFPENFVKSPYWRLAKALDLRYRALIGGPGDYDQRFAVDVGSVIAAVQEN